MIFKLLSNTKYEKIIYHAPSREYASGDLLIKKIFAKEKIGFTSDCSIDSYFWINKTKKLYNILVSTSTHSEHTNNKIFLHSLGAKNNIKSNKKLSYNSDATFKLTSNYLVLFVGARIEIRKWNIHNFITLAELFLSNTKFDLVICGGTEDINDANTLKKHFINNPRIINLAGKTNIDQLCGIIDHSKLLIGNETSGIHFASSLHTESICILGGGHFNRFVPYATDKDFVFKPNVVYQKMDCFNCNWRCKYLLTNSKTAPCIASIHVQNVYSMAIKLLSY